MQVSSVDDLKVSAMDYLGPSQRSWIAKPRRAALFAVVLLVCMYLFLSQSWTPAPSLPPVATEAVVEAPPPMKGTPTVTAQDRVVPPIHIAPTPTPTPEFLPEPWSFNATRDRNNHSLTSHQCGMTFPRLYTEIERAEAYWKERLGGEKIGRERFDLKWSGDGGLTAMIYNQQLYITHSRGLNHFLHWKERSMATLHQIQRAILASPEPIPNIEFSIKINDQIGLTAEHPDVTVWAFSRNIFDPVMEQTWIVPDFNFWSYPRVSGSFGDFQRQAMEIGDNFDQKIDLLVWRGTTSFNPELREPLLWQSEGQRWSDVRRVDENLPEDQLKYRISMPDHCKYKYAVHTEGTTWSGRLKYLLSCRSVAVIHKLTWHTHLYHLLQSFGPTQNYVQVENDWADLPSKMDALLADPTDAKRIADNAASTFRDLYMTPAAQTCYWRHLFEVWSEMTFDPDPYEYGTSEDGTAERRWRGMTYEEYVFYDKSVPPEE